MAIGPQTSRTRTKQKKKKKKKPNGQPLCVIWLTWIISAEVMEQKHLFIFIQTLHISGDETKPSSHKMWIMHYIFYKQTHLK